MVGLKRSRWRASVVRSEPLSSPKDQTLRALPWVSPKITVPNVSNHPKLQWLPAQFNCQLRLKYRNSQQYRKIVLLRFFPVFGSVSVLFNSFYGFMVIQFGIDFSIGLPQVVFFCIVIHDILQIKLNIMYLLCGLQSANLDSKNSGLPATVGKAQRAIVF